MLNRLLMPRTHAVEKFAWVLMGNLASTIYTTAVQGSEFDGIQQLWFFITALFFLSFEVNVSKKEVIKVKYNSKLNWGWDEDHPVLLRLLIECLRFFILVSFGFAKMTHSWKDCCQAEPVPLTILSSEWDLLVLFSLVLYYHVFLLQEKQYIHCITVKLDMMRPYWFVWLRCRIKWPTKDRSLSQQETKISERLYTFLWNAA